MARGLATAPLSWRRCSLIQNKKWSQFFFHSPAVGKIYSYSYLKLETLLELMTISVQLSPVSEDGSVS